MSQKSDILAALQKGETITALDALKRFGCFRLAARIYDLSMYDGWLVLRRDVKLPSGKMITGYYLDKSGQLGLGV